MRCGPERTSFGFGGESAVREILRLDGVAWVNGWLIVTEMACSENAIQSPIITPCFFEQNLQLLHQFHLGSLQVQNGSPSPLPRSG